MPNKLKFLSKFILKIDVGVVPIGAKAKNF